MEHKDIMFRSYKRIKNANRSRSVSKPPSKKAKLTKKTPAASLSLSRVSNAPLGGTRFKARLLYSEIGRTVATPIGACGVHVWNLGGLFDIDVTGVGHQPAGFDQIMAIYEQFLVLGGTYKVSISNSSTGDSVIHGVSSTDQLTAATDPRVYLENGMTQWNTVSGKTETGPSISYFSGQWDNAALHGLTKTEYMGDDLYKGNATVNPQESVYLHVWAATSGGAAGSNQLINIAFEFDCVFTGGKLNSLS